MTDESSIKVHHVAINVPDIDASIKWYGDVLGFTVERRDFIKGFRGRNALIKLGEFRIELFQNENIVPRPEEEVPPPGTEMLGFRQLAFSVADPTSFTEMLERHGADITMRRSDGTALFIRDNSGNVLEFIAQS